ncbi:MAG: hypothetical protein K2V38_19520, partial [Gemmataceae bacterium]|nr:hypothetical protein [Gemmataceae bacterium]
GAYDDRPLEPGDLNELNTLIKDKPWDDDRMEKVLEKLYDGCEKHTEQRAELYKEMESLQSSVVGRPSPKLKRQIEDVEKQQDENWEWFKSFDRRVYLLHVQMAEQVDKEAKQELVERYRFQLEVQRLYQASRAAFEKADRYLSVHAKLAQEQRLSSEFVGEVLRVLRESWKTLKGIIKDAREINLPAMKNFEEGERLADFILEGKMVPEPPLSYAKGVWINKLMQQLQGVRLKCFRLHFKSVGGVLRLQEEIAAKWKAAREPIAAQVVETETTPAEAEVIAAEVVEAEVVAEVIAAEVIAPEVIAPEVIPAPKLPALAPEPPKEVVSLSASPAVSSLPLPPTPPAPVTVQVPPAPLAPPEPEPEPEPQPAVVATVVTQVELPAAPAEIAGLIDPPAPLAPPELEPAFRPSDTLARANVFDFDAPEPAPARAVEPDVEPGVAPDVRSEVEPEPETAAIQAEPVASRPTPVIPEKLAPPVPSDAIFSLDTIDEPPAAPIVTPVAAPVVAPAPAFSGDLFSLDNDELKAAGVLPSAPAAPVAPAPAKVVTEPALSGLVEVPTPRLVASVPAAPAQPEPKPNAAPTHGLKPATGQRPALRITVVRPGGRSPLAK